MTDHRAKRIDATGDSTPSSRPRKRAAPFVKWAGGKRPLIPYIMASLPPSFGAYYEPFLGGGAVFLALADRIGEAVLSDANAELIRAYQVIQADPEALIALLERHKEAHGEADYYYKVRDRYNAGRDDPEDRPASVARFIYLNKTCYNGLYRVNSRGGFNVPKGRYANPAIYSRENLLAVSEALKNATLHTRDFEAIDPKPGDFIYCDPPYDNTFDSYAAGGFGEAGQKRLKACMDRWREKGCHVLLSNSDTPLIRRLYKEYRIEEVAAPRPINSKADGRGMTAELLVMGYDTRI